MNSKSSATIAGLRRKAPFAILLSVLLSLAQVSPACAQKKKKKDQDDAAAAQQAASSVIASLPDEQKIDHTIGEMLGAWQLGDIEKLHKTMADDASVVAGTWTPPAIGWTSYLAAYNMQRARMQQVRMDRSNTLIRIAPSKMVAWACYQWDFSAVVDGTPSAAEGQTTLVLEKRGDDWVIVHNHTSLIQASQGTAPAAGSPQPVATPPAKP